MTPLESKTIRDSRGINTYERGLFYATLLLITSNISPDNTKVGAANPYYDAIKLSFERGKIGKINEKEGSEEEEIDPKIVIEAHLPYNKEFSLKTGGNFFEQIQSFNNIDPNPFAISIQPHPLPFDIIKDDPTWVNSLEKYIVWLAMAIEFQTYYYDESYPRKAEITFVESGSNLSFIKIDAALPYNHAVFLKERNLLSALKNYPITK